MQPRQNSQNPQKILIKSDRGIPNPVAIYIASNVYSCGSAAPVSPRHI